MSSHFMKLVVTTNTRFFDMRFASKDSQWTAGGFCGNTYAAWPYPFEADQLEYNFWLFFAWRDVLSLGGMYWKMRSRSLIRYKKCNDKCSYSLLALEPPARFLENLSILVTLSFLKIPTLMMTAKFFTSWSKISSLTDNWNNWTCPFRAKRW